MTRYKPCYSNSSTSNDASSRTRPCGGEERDRSRSSNRHMNNRSRSSDSYDQSESSRGSSKTSKSSCSRGADYNVNVSSCSNRQYHQKPTSHRSHHERERRHRRKSRSRTRSRHRKKYRKSILTMVKKQNLSLFNNDKKNDNNLLQRQVSNDFAIYRGSDIYNQGYAQTIKSLLSTGQLWLLM
ncbi:unnamed protein product [Didymodactylos carnosus]|uniref:Uncharacterized protein n=1 Tax=Didymodactylos carnosus TaxID=1234261 RepID=A0A813W247_9BILA|nr:unnamed protein product [Didymodactylos carnosus]CAF0846956.1 unnamed protein product [Didymodactylos carnosus]CAF3508742.1 unnamed protein product [Didymodactylos carnosus]CAF3634618.1 unnamed protein product [Didymodactylos carnosus]